MTIELLLNPKSEKNMLDWIIALDIFESVKCAREVHKNSSINGGNNDIDNDLPVIECSSHHKLQ